MLFKKKQIKQITTTPENDCVIYKDDSLLTAREKSYKYLVWTNLQLKARIFKEISSLKNMKKTLEVLEDSPYKTSLRDEYKKTQKMVTDMLKDWDTLGDTFKEYSDINEAQPIKYEFRTATELLEDYCRDQKI